MVREYTNTFTIYDSDCPRRKLGTVKAGNLDRAMAKIQASKKYKGLGRVNIEWWAVTGHQASISANV